MLGWQSGGAIGDGRLRAVGPVPWQLGGAVAVEVLVVSLAVARPGRRACAGSAARSTTQDEVGFLLDAAPTVAGAVDAEDEPQPTKPAKQLTKLAG